MEALGRELDLSIAYAPVDLNTAGATGKRISMRNCTGITIVTMIAASGGTESLVFTLQQHTASTGGTTANLAIVDHFYMKYATTLAGTETWVRFAQTASQTVTLADTLTQTATPSSAVLTGFGAKQALLAVEVGADQLSDTYAYISWSVADPGSTARLSSSIYIPHDLSVQRRATNLVANLA